MQVLNWVIRNHPTFGCSAGSKKVTETESQQRSPGCSGKDHKSAGRNNEQVLKQTTSSYPLTDLEEQDMDIDQSSEDCLVVISKTTETVHINVPCVSKNDLEEGSNSNRSSVSTNEEERGSSVKRPIQYVCVQSLRKKEQDSSNACKKPIQNIGMVNVVRNEDQEKCTTGKKSSKDDSDMRGNYIRDLRSRSRQRSTPYVLIPSSKRRKTESNAGRTTTTSALQEQEECVGIGQKGMGTCYFDLIFFLSLSSLFVLIVY